MSFPDRARTDELSLILLCKATWEFRTKFLGKQIRVFAFWDKTNKIETLVLATNGFIIKTSKSPKSEIERAERIRREYFSNKKTND